MVLNAQNANRLRSSHRNNPIPRATIVLDFTVQRWMVALPKGSIERRRQLRRRCGLWVDRSAFLAGTEDENCQKHRDARDARTLRVHDGSAYSSRRYFL